MARSQRRVNYTVKSCLIQMQEKDDFNLDSAVHRYCVSWITLHVSVVGTQLFVQTWNNYYIPSKILACVITIHCLVILILIIYQEKESLMNVCSIVEHLCFKEP